MNDSAIVDFTIVFDDVLIQAPWRDKPEPYELTFTHYGTEETARALRRALITGRVSVDAVVKDERKLH